MSPARGSVLDRICTALLAAAVFLAPFASVGLLQVVAGRSAGTGVQPAFLPLAALIACEFLRRGFRGGVRPGEQTALIALLWMAIAVAVTWTLPDMGLAGDEPWSKATKQFALWSFFALGAVAVVRTLERGHWIWPERALAGGLLLSVVIGLVAPFVELPWLDTNRSIASGSDELYLGHAFTGLSRLRGPMPEPLMFGSYLLAAVPLVAASAWNQHGFARAWRVVTAILGLVCLAGTWSRGAWLGAVAAAVLFGVLWARGRFGCVGTRRVILAACGFGLGGLFAFSFALGVAPWEVPELLYRRVVQSFAGHDMSNMTRVWSWGVAWDLFRESPVYGHGWGSFGFLFFQRASEVASGAHFGWPVTNNLALLLLAETGLVGLALWSFALWPAFAVIGRAGSSRRSLVLAIAVTGLLVQLATFSQWNLPHLWLTFGAALAAARVPARSGG